jgi:hypothetical protein
VVEQVPVRFDVAELEGQELKVERVKEHGPAREVVLPMQRVGIAEATRGHCALHAPKERLGSGERAAGPAPEGVEERLWLDR